MANDFNAAISVIYSKKTARNYDNNGITSKIINKDYEKEIKSEGDTVKIQRVDDVIIMDYAGVLEQNSQSISNQDFVIDQQKYFNIPIGRIDEKQANLDLINKYTERSSVAMALVKDTRILSHVAQAHADNTISTSVVTKDSIYDKMCIAMQKLEDSNAVDDQGKYGGKMPFFIVNPALKTLIKTSPEFTQATKMGEDMLRKGSFGEIAGFDVMCTTNFSAVAGTYNVMFGTNEAISYASQIEDFAIDDNPNAFGKRIKGLYVYGSKVINPLSLGKVVWTLS